MLVALGTSGCAGQPSDVAGVDAGSSSDGWVGQDATVAHSDAAPPADSAPPIELPDISFDHYHSQEEIAAYLRAVADAAPWLVEFEVLGESALGREVALVAIDATGMDDPPAMYVNGTHHGDEKCGTETALGVIDYLLRHRDEGEVHELLSRYAIYVQPLVNPDGHAADTREDAYGNDPNRDYLIPGEAEDQAFQMVETRLVRDLHLRVGFRASIAYHGGAEVILWPWGYTYVHTDDHDLFNTLAGIGAAGGGLDAYYQSVEMYPSQGEYSDWAYWVDGTLSITYELDNDKEPPVSRLAASVDSGVAGSVAYLDAVSRYDAGELTVVPESKIQFGRAGRPVILDGKKPE